MIVEERNYHLVAGGLSRYLETWTRCGREPQVRHLGEPLGVYTVDVGDLNTVVYVWGFLDADDRAVRRARLAADVDFASFRGQVRELVVAQTNRLLVPAAMERGEG